ncbi:Uncharacterised protein [Yersinia intermedia]|nr:Uncharacterised protein [Yersinia intermedia]
MFQRWHAHAMEGQRNHERIMALAHWLILDIHAAWLVSGGNLEHQRTVTYQDATCTVGIQCNHRTKR